MLLPMLAVLTLTPRVSQKEISAYRKHFPLPDGTVPDGWGVNIHFTVEDLAKTLKGYHFIDLKSAPQGGTFSITFRDTASGRKLQLMWDTKDDSSKPEKSERSDLGFPGAHREHPE